MPDLRTADADADADADAEADRAPWFDRWIAPDVRREGGLRLHKSRSQVLLAVVGAGAFTVSAAVEFGALGPSGVWFGGLDLLAVVMCVGFVGVQRRVRDPQVTGNLIAFSSFAMLLVTSAMTGGADASLLASLPLACLVAVATVGVRSGVVWLAATVTAVVLLFAIETTGVVVVPEVIAGPEARSRRALMVLTQAALVFTIAYAWSREQRAVVAELERARDVAHEADQAKSNLIAIVSHELRTPMNGVLGMLDLLVDAPLTELQHQYADTARTASRGLLGILDDLLDRARLESGRLGLDVVGFIPEAVLRSLESIIELGALGRQVPVVFELEDGLDHPVRGDPRRLRQVLHNLVGNALKFTAQGQVVVRARGERSREGVRITIEVSDTGIGIPEDRLPFIFDAFTQADGSVTRRYGGTGLGLSIARDLVELMGGRIAVRSTVGTGTTFTVTLPLEHAPLESVEAPTDPSVPGELFLRGARVLVAEDNRVNQLVIRGYLAQHGVELSCVDDGEQAIAAASNQGFDLVLMDCEMPVIDGFEATRRLRDAGYVGPIIALTAHASQHVRTRCLEAGMDGFLAKPVSSAALLRVLVRFGADRRTRRTGSV